MAIETPVRAVPAKSRGPALEILPAPGNLTRDAAVRLGAVFLELARMRATPLDAWAVAPEKGRGLLHGPFYAALGIVYGSDTERERKYGRASYQSRFALYKQDYDAVVPQVLVSTYSFATLALNAEAIALTTLLTRITSEKGLAEWLHKACEDIVASLTREAKNREMRKEEARRAGLPPPSGADVMTFQEGPGISYISPNEYKKIVRDLASKRVRYAGDDVLRILFEHPEGMTILRAYASSAAEGTQAARLRLLQAIEAVEKFAEKVTKNKQALRYPFFIIGGVIQRGLRDVPGFTEFAVSLGPVLARDATDAVLSFAAIAVGCLALVFAGPSAPAVVAGVLFAGADLAFAGVSMGRTYMREREQDLGHQASAFRTPGSEFATRAIYLDTALAGAAALLSAIAVFGALKDLRAVLNAGPKSVATVPPKQPSTPAGARLTTAPENKAITGRATDGAQGASETLKEGTLVKRQPSDERYVTATSKDDMARATQKDAAANRFADEQTALTGKQESRPRGSADQPDVQPAQQRMTSRALEESAPAPPSEPVPARKLRETERENLREQIRQKKAEYDAQSAAKDKVRERMHAVAIQRNRARARGDAAETARLDAELKEIRDEFDGFELGKLVEEKGLLKQLLERNSAEYFESLAAAAASRKEYTSLAKGALDEVFKPVAGPRWIEHVYPKSKIFGTPGFLDKLIWEQQIFLFNLPKNLKVSPAAFNRARGVVPYRSLDYSFWSAHLRSEQAFADLVTLEAEVERDVARLIADPHNALLWRRLGYEGPFK